MNKIVIACSKKWFFNNEEVRKFIKKKNIITIINKKKINQNYLDKINPKIIFFPHWSHKVNSNITEKYNCICFHAAPLPYGRGGSPIQNLILKNFKKTPVCAIKMTNEIDTGPIYLKEIISLSGSLDNIFERISLSIIKMIKVLITKKIKPIKQKGRIYKFKRINERKSIISKERNLKEIFDKIRMLDSNEYPNAYIIKNNHKIVFRNPTLKKKIISCKVKIFKIEK